MFSLDSTMPTHGVAGELLRSVDNLTAEDESLLAAVVSVDATLVSQASSFSSSSAERLLWIEPCLQFLCVLRPVISQYRGPCHT